MPEPDRAAFIRHHLAVVGVGDMRLYQAHPGSGLRKLGDVPPYWAYVWAGGAALARHILGHPDLVRGKRVVDFGAGCGVVAIAAAQAGAQVVAIDPDPWARAATVENAALNGVVVQVAEAAAQELPDLVLAGDVFYDATVAAVSVARFDLWRAQGVRVLIGDPGRADLPRQGLVRLAEYTVRDMGDSAARPAAVYDYRPGALFGGQITG